MAHEIEELDNVMLGSNTAAWHRLPGGNRTR